MIVTVSDGPTRKPAFRAQLDLIPKPNGRQWVRVNVTNNKTGLVTCRWVPSFEDLYRTVCAIAACEDVAYPHGRGGAMGLELLAELRRRGRGGLPDQWTDDGWFYALSRGLMQEYDVPTNAPPGPLADIVREWGDE